MAETLNGSAFFLGEDVSLALRVDEASVFLNDSVSVSADSVETMETLLFLKDDLREARKVIMRWFFVRVGLMILRC